MTPDSEKREGRALLSQLTPRRARQAHGSRNGSALQQKAHTRRSTALMNLGYKLRKMPDRSMISGSHHAFTACSLSKSMPSTWLARADLLVGSVLKALLSTGGFPERGIPRVSRPI